MRWWGNCPECHRENVSKFIAGVAVVVGVILITFVIVS